RPPAARKARYAVILSSGKSFQSPANSRSDRLPRASLRTTSLKLSPSFLTWASATSASSDRVIVFTVMSPWMSANVCQPSRPLDESHYIQAGHRPTQGVRSLPRTAEEVPAAPRTHGSARAVQQARSPRRPVRGTGDGPPRSDRRARDGRGVLGPPRRLAGESREGDRDDNPRGIERAVFHLRRTAHLGIHVPDPRRAPRLRRAQRLSRGSRGGFGLCRRRSSRSGSSIAATRSRLETFSRSRADVVTSSRETA